MISVSMTVLGIGGYPLLLPYGWHLFLHVLGAVLFMGNIIVSALWMVIAELSGDKAALRFAAGALNWADVVFTAPGIFLLLVNGFILAYASWDGLTQSWIIWALNYQARCPVPRHFLPKRASVCLLPASLDVKRRGLESMPW